jgi:uncharacterized membrane protein
MKNPIRKTTRRQMVQNIIDIIKSQQEDLITMEDAVWLIEEERNNFKEGQKL